MREMYCDYYNLVENPFRTNPDPKYLWLGEKHEEALAFLKYGIYHSVGFLLLTGDVGTGKTTLVNALVNYFHNEVLLASIVDPKLNKFEFFNELARKFNIGRTFREKYEFIQYFRRSLDALSRSKKKAVVVIDEAQNLSVEVLEEIRLLSNMEKSGDKLLNFFFVGQPEFKQVLLRHECRALKQRIVMAHHIEPLTRTEIKEYINFRLKVSGAAREIFTKAAIRPIYTFSGGYPRLINIICNNALLTGSVNELPKVTPAVIHKCAEELDLHGGVNRGAETEFKPGRVKRTLPSVRRLAYLFLLPLAILIGFLLAPTAVKDFIVDMGRVQGQSYERKEIPQPALIPPQNDTLILQDSGATKIGFPQLEKSKGSSSMSDYASSAKSPVVTRVVTEHKSEKPSFSIDDFKLVIPFDRNSIAMPTRSYGSLDELVGIMQSNEDIGIVVKGYTDSVGDRTYNRRLSEFRADMVKSYLVGKGISPKRIESIGMGEENPLASNATQTGQRANRRVEIELASASRL